MHTFCNIEKTLLRFLIVAGERGAAGAERDVYGSAPPRDGDLNAASGRYHPNFTRNDAKKSTIGEEHGCKD